ncbi:hypothetical protein [Algisphaera agarilytica]|uniref:Uncharacterized protein n=1 Tax=Algisphaera agarilytica TaxID=1385975 RepID=A0A7X0H4L7_9BACT|nr:hypothetical protein [Algisphaera agarilytica]MBB6428998.1 hypothetical protein [Algisphaera agarilytica]
MRSPSSGSSPEGTPPAAAVHRAWTQIQQGGYAAAAEVLERYDPSNLNVAIPFCLSRNLRALQVHRPEILTTLEQAGLFSTLKRYPLVPTASGRLAPACADPDAPAAAPVPLSTNPDPSAAADLAMQRLAEHINAGKAIVFADVIDGYLISKLADAKPTLGLGMQQAIYIAEPDPHLLTASLMVHDWSGPDSPITDPRFTWFVGERAWLDFEIHMRRNRMLPLPVIKLGREAPRAAIGEILERCHAYYEACEAKWARKIEKHYSDFQCDALTVGTATRPKVLLITCRFTTVLKYSTADCEQAFARLGWRTRTLIEPGDTHRLTRSAIRHALATFKPDLVFTIDQLRAHCLTPFPERLPFVCWVQDQLSRFTTRKAGASITPRDFVLSMVGPMYTRQWGYPARQIVEMPKLTRPPARPDKWVSTGDDLVYVSNASQRPADLIDALDSPLLKACADEMVQRYEAGESLPAMGDVGRIVDRVSRKQNQTLSAANRALAVNTLYHPLNNALYRQQALGWAAQAAEDLGLSFALYGQGWQDHPDFAAYARGPVAYGPDLEELTRQSKINLQIVPSFCLHQRLLDGLVAGGFFLIRQHPSDTLIPKLLGLIDPEAKTVNEALEAAGSKRDELKALLKQAGGLADLGTPVDMVEFLRGCQRAELLNHEGESLPKLDEVSFHDADSLRKHLETYSDYAALRRRVATEQRESVEHRLSYTAGLRRTLARIGQLIAEEPPDLFPDNPSAASTITSSFTFAA